MSSWVGELRRVGELGEDLRWKLGGGGEAGGQAGRGSYTGRMGAGRETLISLRAQLSAPSVGPAEGLGRWVVQLDGGAEWGLGGRAGSQAGRGSYAGRKGAGREASLWAHLSASTSRPCNGL